MKRWKSFVLGLGLIYYDAVLIVGMRKNINIKRMIRYPKLLFIVYFLLFIDY
jgi:hypothetical protein